MAFPTSNISKGTWSIRSPFIHTFLEFAKNRAPRRAFWPLFLLSYGGLQGGCTKLSDLGGFQRPDQQDPISGSPSPGFGGISQAADDHPHVAKRQRRNSVGPPKQPILLPIDLLKVGDLGSLSRLD